MPGSSHAQYEHVLAPAHLPYSNSMMAVCPRDCMNEHPLQSRPVVGLRRPSSCDAAAAVAAPGSALHLTHMCDVFIRHIRIFNEHRGLSSERNVLFQQMVDDLFDTSVVGQRWPEIVGSPLQLAFPEWRWTEGELGGFTQEDPSSHIIVERLHTILSDLVSAVRLRYNLVPVLLNRSVVVAPVELTLKCMRLLDPSWTTTSRSIHHLVRHDPALIGAVLRAGVTSAVETPFEVSFGFVQNTDVDAYIIHRPCPSEGERIACSPVSRAVRSLQFLEEMYETKDVYLSKRLAVIIHSLLENV